MKMHAKKKSLKKIRASRNNDELNKVLSEIEKASESGKGNLLGLAVKAAKLRGTVGEISDAMEKVFGRYSPEIKVVSGAYRKGYKKESEFNDLLNKIKEFENNKGRRPRILVAKMGQDGHDRGAKVIASGFADLGFDVDVGPLFQTPEEVVNQAINCDVHCIGISSQAAGHLTLIPQLIQTLKVFLNIFFFLLFLTFYFLFFFFFFFLTFLFCALLL